MTTVAPKSNFQETKDHTTNFLLHIQTQQSDVMLQYIIYFSLFLSSFGLKYSNKLAPAVNQYPWQRNIDEWLTVTRQRRSFRHKLLRLSEPSAQSNESKLSIKFWERERLSVKPYQVISALCLCPILGYLTQGNVNNTQESKHITSWCQGLAKLDKEKEDLP